jgi:hypothetical protein
MQPKRNAKCPCGKGHKFKKCCGKARTDWQKAMWARIVAAFTGA